MPCWRGEDREDRLKKMSLHTWEWVWFPVRSCTTSAQLWGRPDRPPSGSFHLYPPDMLVPASLQKLWKDETKVTKETPRWRFPFNQTWRLIFTQEHIQNLENTYLPSLFFSSFGIFFILRSRPLRSVMPYMKAIFSYWSGRAFFRISHTSTSGVSSCFGSLVVPDTRERCEGRGHRLVFATCPEELLINL